MQGRYVALLANGCFVRSLHYHETPRARAGLYDEQCAYVAGTYTSLSPDALMAATASGVDGGSVWIGSFDGYRASADVLCPILDKYGLRGWFLLVTEFLDSACRPQEKELERLLMESVRPYENHRFAMTWDEARERLARHEVVNHTVTHCRADNEPVALAEIEQAQRRIWDMLERKPFMAAFLGGARLAQSRTLKQRLPDAGVSFAVGTEMECLTAEERTLPPGRRLCDEAEARRALERLNRFRARRHFTDGVPAILPFAQAAPMRTERTEWLADLFRRVCEAERARGQSEWDACMTALDAAALEAMGRDFPINIE